MSAVIEFGFSAAPVFTGLDRLENRLNTFESKVSRLGDVFGATFRGAAVATAVTVFAGYLKSTANELSAVVDSADRLRSTPETIQRVTKAAEILGGTDLETIATGLDKLTRELVQSPDSGLARSLADLGFNAQAFLGADLDEKLLLVADAFGVAQQRGTVLPVLTDALGKGFSKLLPTLQTGRAALQDFLDTTAVIDNQTVLKVDAINDRFDTMTSKLATSAKVLALGLGLGLGEAVGLLPRTQPGDEARANAAIEAAAKEKRAAEVAAAAREMARLKAQAAFDEATKAHDAEREQILKNAEAQSRLDEDKRRMALEEMDTSTRIVTLQEQLDDALEWERTLRADFVPDAERLIAAESRSLVIRRELNAALKEQQRTQEELTSAIAREAQEAARANAQRKQAVMSAQDEYNLLQAKSTRRKGDDYQVEREQAIRRRREQFMRDNGMSFAEANARATEMRDMEERISNNGNVQKIRGVKPPKRRSSLDEWQSKQGDVWAENNQIWNSDWDWLQKMGFGWEKNLVPSSKRGTLDDKAAANAATPTPKDPTSILGELLQTVRERLPVMVGEQVATALMSN